MTYVWSSAKYTSLFTEISVTRQNYFRVEADMYNSYDDTSYCLSYAPTSMSPGMSLGIPLDAVYETDYHPCPSASPPNNGTVLPTNHTHGAAATFSTSASTSTTTTTQFNNHNRITCETALPAALVSSSNSTTGITSLSSSDKSTPMQHTLCPYAKATVSTKQYVNGRTYLHDYSKQPTHDQTSRHSSGLRSTTRSSQHITGEPTSTILLTTDIDAIADPSSRSGDQYSYARPSAPQSYQQHSSMSTTTTQLNNTMYTKDNNIPSDDPYILLSNASEYPPSYDHNKSDLVEDFVKVHQKYMSSNCIQKNGPLRADHQICTRKRPSSRSVHRGYIQQSKANLPTPSSTPLTCVTNIPSSMNRCAPPLPTTTYHNTTQQNDHCPLSTSDSDSAISSYLSAQDADSEGSGDEFPSSSLSVAERTLCLLGDRLQTSTSTDICNANIKAMSASSSEHNQLNHNRRKRVISTSNSISSQDSKFECDSKKARCYSVNKHSLYHHDNKDACSLSSSSFASSVGAGNYAYHYNNHYARSNPLYGSIATNPYVRRRSTDVKLQSQSSLHYDNTTASSLLHYPGQYLPDCVPNASNFSLLPAPLPLNLTPYNPSSGSTVAADECSYRQRRPHNVGKSIETQTSPHAERYEHHVKSTTFISYVQEDNQINTHRSRSNRRNSGSRRIIESFCRSAKNTIGNLRRAMSADNLDKSDASDQASVTSSMHPYQHQASNNPKKMSKKSFSIRNLSPSMSTISSASTTLLSNRAGYFQHKKERHSTTVTLKAVSKRLSPRRPHVLARPVSFTSTPIHGKRSSKDILLGRHDSITPYIARSRIMGVHEDGSKTVKLVRPENRPFGFFVTKRSTGLYVSRMADNLTQYHGIVSIGDEIIEIEGLPCKQMSLEEVHSAIGRRHSVTFKIRPQ